MKERFVMYLCTCIQKILHIKVTSILFIASAVVYIHLHVITNLFMKIIIVKHYHRFTIQTFFS